MKSNESNIKVMLQAVLDKIKSITNIITDIKAIEPKLPRIKIQGKLDTAASQKELNSKMKGIRPKVNVDADTTQAEKKVKEIEKQRNETTITTALDNTQVVSGLKQVQKETQSLWKRFTANIFGNNLVRMGTQKVVQAVHEAFQSIRELDTIKTNIQVLSGTTDFDANAMMASYNAMAKDFSSTTKDVAEAADEFLRMGESIASTNELIRSSQILSKIGMMNSADAAGYLISCLRGYQVAAEDSLDIVNKLTSVDLEAAVSAGGLSEALSKCADIANTSGISMDRLIGYTAAVGETTQKSMAEVGDSFRSLLNRMNNIKLGRLIDEETGESLSDTETVLGKLGIKLRDTENIYRSFDEVLDQVGSRWESLTKAEQNALSEAIAGTGQGENFEILMDHWSNALKYSETAANSAGLALERYGVYQDSIEAKTNELTAALEALFTSTISEELYSGIIEAATGIVELLDKANLLKASFAGLMAMGVAKAVASIGAGFITAAKSTAQLSAAMAMFDKGLGADNLRNMGHACKGLNNNQLRLILSTKGLRTEQRLTILEGMGVAEAEQKQMLATLGFAAAEDKAAVSAFSLKGAFRSLGTAMAASPIGMIVTAVTVATMAFTGFNRAMEEARQKAKELGDSFNNAKAEIEDYKSQIEELYQTINDNGSSIEDITNARKSLISVQNELIDKFGTEQDVIDNVTKAINGQADALDELEGVKWQEMKNEFNDVGFFHNIVNGIQGRDNIGRMLDEYEERSVNIQWTNYADINALTDEMVAKLENIGVNIKVHTDDLQGIRDFDSLTESISDMSDAYLTVTGNAGEVYNQLLALQKLADTNSLDKLYDKLGSAANYYKDLTETYKAAYDQYILYDKILNEDSDYADVFKEITDAYEEYREAFASGDESKIKESTEKYAEVLTGAVSAANARGDASVATYFENMYPSLRSSVEGWKFHVAFDANTNDLQNTVQSVLGELKDENGRVLTAEEILGLNEANGQYRRLASIAHSYNMSIEEMIELLKERNIVSAMDAQRLAELFGRENVDKLSEEDIEIAFRIKDISDMTFEELLAEIERRKEAIAESAAVPLSLSDTISQLNTRLKSAFDSLKSAYNDIFTDDGGFALNSIDIISTCDSIKSKLNELNETEGITVDFSFYEDFIGVLNNTESKEQDVEAAFDSLATSITQAALTGKEDFATMKAALEDLGVINNEIVAFDALISNTEALKEAGLDLADATDEEMEAFAKGIGITENYDQAINLLRIQKILCNENPLSTAEDINELGRLAQAAGIATDAIQQLTGLNSAYEMAVESGNTIASTAVRIQMDMVRKQVVDQFSQLKTGVDFSGIGGGVSRAKSAGKNAGKSYADAWKDELSNLNSVISYIGDVIGDQIDLFKDQKDAAVEALEAEKEAAEEALEAEKELAQEKIDAKQAEIDAIEDAARARKNELDLQKAQYELERMQNQRSVLQFSQDKGMHYVIDTKEAREAKEAVTEARENIRTANMEKEISGLNDIIDDLDRKIEESNEYYDELIHQTEKYWDSLIKGLEEYRSRWQELADIENQAKMEVMLRNLGITTDDVLNMSESAFESFKSTYVGLLNEMYSGNDDMLHMLQEFGGITEGTLKPLSGTISTVAESLGRYAESVSTADANTTAVSERMGAINNNAAGLNDHLSGVSGILDAVLEDNRLETAAEQLGNVAESVQSISDALNDMPAETDMGSVIEQFDALGNSVDKVSASISGGKVSKAGASDGTPGKNVPGTKGGAGGGFNSLVGAVKEVGTETDRTIGTGEGSGAIGRFHRLGESVTGVTAAIGGGSESREDHGNESSGDLIGSIVNLGETTVETLGEPGGEGVTGKFGEMSNAIGEAESHVTGILDGLRELDNMDPVECTIVVNIETRGSVPDIASGTTVGDTVGSMNLNSSEYKAKYRGSAHVEGTANVTGNWGVSNPGRSLVGEEGQELWVHAKDGTFETVGDHGAEFIQTEKNDIIFNHLQTQELLSRGRLSGRGGLCKGKAYIDGTNGVSVTKNGNVLTPYNPDTDISEFGKLVRTWDKHYGKISDGMEEIQKTFMHHVTMEYSQKMHNEVNRFISQSNSVMANHGRNVQPVVNQAFHITMPNVTNATSAERLMHDLQSLSTKKYQVDWNK